MTVEINRRSFLHLGMAAGAAALAPRWILAQASAAQPADRVAQMRAAGASTPIKTTKLYDNLWLLQGAGGNMAVQTGKDGNILIDSSFATAVPAYYARPSPRSAAMRPHALVNTHWHVDHVDGNEGMHAAGFHVIAHEKTKTRMAEPAEMKLFHLSLPAYPAGAIPSVTFATTMSHNHNGDTIELVHYDPAHTDTDIYIHFHNADVLHCGDIFFNKLCTPSSTKAPAARSAAPLTRHRSRLRWPATGPRSSPAMGRWADKAELEELCRHALAGARQSCGAQESRRQRAGSDRQKTDRRSRCRHGCTAVSPDMFVGIVYRTV